MKKHVYFQKNWKDVREMKTFYFYFEGLYVDGDWQLSVGLIKFRILNYKYLW